MNRREPTDLASAPSGQFQRTLSRHTSLLGVAIALTLLVSTACLPGGGGSGASSETETETDEPAPPPAPTPPAALTRSFAMNFLPSASQAVDGYEIALGESSGDYETVLDIPISATIDNGSVLTYEITLENDREYFLVLRAYNAGGFSENSNEMHIGAGSAALSRILNEPSAQASAPTPNSVASFSSGSLGTSAANQESQTVEADGGAPSETLADTDSKVDGVRGANDDTIENNDSTSLDFDGEGEYLANMESDLLGIEDAFTLSMWLRPGLDDAERRTLLDLGSVASDANRLTLSVVNTATLEMNLHDSNGDVMYHARFDDALLDREWQHLAVVIDGQVGSEPRLYLDAQPQAANESASPESLFGMSDSARRVVMGVNMTAPDDSWRGQLGHTAMWNIALDHAAIDALSAGGHGTDLRSTDGSTFAPETLMHYWRLGADPDGIGFDHGNARIPIDLDDTRGGIGDEDIVVDGPALLQSGQSGQSGAR